MSVGSIWLKRTSYMKPPISSVTPRINSDLPMPGGPHRNTGRLTSKQTLTRLRASVGVTVRDSVTAILYTPCENDFAELKLYCMTDFIICQIACYAASNMLAGTLYKPALVRTKVYLILTFSTVPV